MAAFFVATVKIKDQEKLQEYAGAVGPIIASHGGEFVSRGKVETALSGSAAHQMAAIVKFPTMDALKGWYASPEYKEIIPVREQGADVTIVAYEALA